MTFFPIYVHMYVYNQERENVIFPCKGALFHNIFWVDSVYTFSTKILIQTVIFLYIYLYFSYKPRIHI